MGEKGLATPQCSVILPPAMRIASTVSNWIFLRVGGGAEELALVRPGVGLVRGDEAAVVRLPVDHRMEIGNPQYFVQFQYARLVGGRAGLRSVVDETVGGQLVVPAVKSERL